MMFPKPEKKPKKRKQQSREYLSARETFLRAHPFCQVCEVDPATEVHHSAGRVQDLLLDERYWFALCHACHEHVHANPRWAYENGLMLERNKVTSPT